MSQLYYTAQPFLTFFTPSLAGRPMGRARLIESVRAAAAVAGPGTVQHCLDVDYDGIGIGEIYRRMPEFVRGHRGQYCHYIADDDVLAHPGVIAHLREIAEREGFPPVLLVKVIKGHLTLPFWPTSAPVEGEIDLGCLVIRNDIWKAHAGDWGPRYEGDADMAKALWAAGHRFADATELLFLVGGVSRGAAEAVPA